MTTPQKKARREVVIDPDSFTVGELETIEDLAGAGVLDEMAGRAPMRAKTAFAAMTVVIRREEPDFEFKSTDRLADIAYEFKQGGSNGAARPPRRQRRAVKRG